MAYLDFLPDNATLIDLFRAYPRLDQLTNELAQEILRGDGELTPAQRETLFAFGSGLNNCHFCHGAHTAIAEAMGVDSELIGQALQDLDSAAVDAGMRALMGYVRKLTLSPGSMRRSDVDAVRAAGWSDRALHEAVAVCALQNFFNRWVDGTGVDAPAEWLAAVGQILAKARYTEASGLPG